MVLHSLGNAKDCERFDAQMEEREKEERKKGLERGSGCVKVGNLERENRSVFEGVESSFLQ